MAVVVDSPNFDARVTWMVLGDSHRKFLRIKAKFHRVQN